MSPFQRARPAPRELLLLASLDKKDRQLIDKTPDLKQALVTAHPTEWAAILEGHHAAQQAARKAAYSRSRRMAFDACAPSCASALRQQGMAYLSSAAEGYAALADGRRNGLFEIVCGLGKYVVHEVLSEDELREPMREAACANGALEDHGEAWFDDCVTRALGYAQNDEPPALAKRSGSNKGVSIMTEDQKPHTLTVAAELPGTGASDPEASSFEGSEGSAGDAQSNPLELDEENQSATSGCKGFREGSGGFQEQEKRNMDWLPAGFRVGRSGAIEHAIGENEWEFLCSSFEISAATRNEDGEDWGRLLRVLDRDGNWHEWAMPMADLAGGGEAYRAKLLNMGLELAPGQKARNALMRLLTAGKPRARARCVTTLGWHDDIFLLPDETVGENPGEQLVLQKSGSFQHNFRCAGTLEGWQDGIGRLSIGNSRLVFSISMAFAAPMLRPLGFEGGGVNLRGASSTGKTTVAEVAGSVCGGGPAGYKTTWRATDNALEGVAAIHNDNFLVLDEIGQVSPDALGQVAYMLANGQAKRRMSREIIARRTSAWCLLYLSTGEISLADKLRESRREARPMAGQDVRVLDISADAGEGLGAFDTLHDYPTGQAFADELKRLSGQHYGHPLRTFLKRLVKEGWREQVKDSVGQFVKTVVPSGADGQIRRVAQRFAIVAAGGRLAQEWGIVPWPPGEAEKAAKGLFEEWLAARGGVEPAEIAAGITEVRLFLDRHGASRFTSWKFPDLATRDCAGFRRGGAEDTPIYSLHDDGKDGEESDRGEGKRVPPPEYYIFPDVWRRDILRGQDSTLIAREMVRRGLLKTNGDGKPQVKVRLPDGTERRVYHVLPEIFADGEGASVEAKVEPSEPKRNPQAK